MMLYFIFILFSFIRFVISLETKSLIDYRVFICVCIRCSEDDHWTEYRWNHLFIVCWLSSGHSPNYCTYRHLYQRYGYFLPTLSHPHRNTYRSHIAICLSGMDIDTWCTHPLKPICRVTLSHTQSHAQTHLILARVVYFILWVSNESVCRIRALLTTACCRKDFSLSNQEANYQAWLQFVWARFVVCLSQSESLACGFMLMRELSDCSWKNSWRCFLFPGIKEEIVVTPF